MVKRGADAVAAQCKAVAEGVDQVSQLPEGVRKMLVKSVGSTLSTLKADRHGFQQKFVDMISEALASLEVQLKEAVTGLDTKVAGADAEKKAKADAQEAAKADLEQKSQSVTEKKAAKEGSTTAAKEAHAALKASELAQKTGDASLADAGTRLERLNALKALFDALKEGTSTEEGAAAKCVKGFKAELSSTDDTMLQTLPSALKKKAADRGTFDQLVMDSVGGELTKLFEKVNEELSSGEGAKQERANAVEAAKKAVEEADNAELSAKTALSDAQAAEKEAKDALKHATAAVSSFDKDMAAVTKALEAAKAELDEFYNVTQKAFTSLDTATKDTPGRFFDAIEGVTCDTAIVNVCRKAAEGDKRVDEDAAKSFYEKIAASGDISQIERWTIRYCLSEFTWTDAAHDYIVAALGALPKANAEEPAAKKRKTKGYYITLDGQKCDSQVIEACQKSVEGQGDGRVSLEDAKAVLPTLADGNKVTPVERWTLRYCFTEFKWTEAARDWITGELKKL